MRQISRKCLCVNVSGVFDVDPAAAVRQRTAGREYGRGEVSTDDAGGTHHYVTRADVPARGPAHKMSVICPTCAPSTCD